MDPADLGKIKGWETKTMTRFFRLKRQKDETWVEDQEDLGAAGPALSV